MHCILHDWDTYAPRLATSYTHDVPAQEVLCSSQPIALRLFLSFSPIRRPLCSLLFSQPLSHFERNTTWTEPAKVRASPLLRQKLRIICRIGINRWPGQWPTDHANEPCHRVSPAHWSVPPFSEESIFFWDEILLCGIWPWKFLWSKYRALDTPAGHSKLNSPFSRPVTLFTIPCRMLASLYSTSGSAPYRVLPCSRTIVSLWLCLHIP